MILKAVNLEIKTNSIAKDFDLIDEIAKKNFKPYPNVTVRVDERTSIISRLFQRKGNFEDRK